jgi:hypothetical protein
MVSSGWSFEAGSPGKLFLLVMAPMVANRRGIDNMSSFQSGATRSDAAFFRDAESQKILNPNHLRVV